VAETFIAVVSSTPARISVRTAERLRSWKSTRGLPAFFAANFSQMDGA
jgi:hypothetical protein